MLYKVARQSLKEDLHVGTTHLKTCSPRPRSYPQEIVYGWTNDNIQPQNTAGDGLGGRMSWGMSIEAIA